MNEELTVLIGDSAAKSGHVIGFSADGEDVG